MESITTENKSVTGERAVSRQAKKRKNSSALILSACAVLLLGGVGAYYISSPWESTDDAFVAGHIVAVSPKVSGHIARVLVTDNESVKQGQVLAEIDNRDYKVALQKAEAKLLGAKARLTQTKTDLARYQALAVKDEISRQILDHAKAANELAVSDLASQEAEVTQASLSLSYTKIYAPQDGKVTKKSIEPGAFVSVGQGLLALVPDKTWVTANFKETQLKYMKAGQPAKIKVDAFGSTISGHVDSIQSGTGAQFSMLPAENATGNFVKVVQRVPVKIVLDNPADAVHLVPGLSVEAKVRVK